MTIQAPPPGSDADPATRRSLGVSPGIGPLPPVYVAPRSATTARALRHAITTLVHLVSDRSASMGGEMPNAGDHLRFSHDHLWVRPNTNTFLLRIGVTDFAQQSLGDVVNVTLPGPGETIDAGKACGDIESVKSVSDLIAPVTGTVRTRNDRLAAAPDLVNADPYGKGWMLEVEAQPADLAEQLEGLLDADAYRQLTGA
jgi:glycine cleavage system H protein